MKWVNYVVFAVIMCVIAMAVGAKIGTRPASSCQSCIDRYIERTDAGLLSGELLAVLDHRGDVRIVPRSNMCAAVEGVTP